MARLASSQLSNKEEANEKRHTTPRQQQLSKPRSSESRNIPIIRGQVTISSGPRRSPPLNALIDTGAAVTLVPQSVVMALGLLPAGSARLTTADGVTRPYDTYWVNVCVQDVRPRMLKVAVSDRKDVLLGRDVLQYCRLIYDGKVGGLSLYEQTRIGATLSWFHFKTLRMRDVLVALLRRRRR